MGYKVEERSLSIDEIMEAYKKGVLNEIFGTGTAATISLIKELKYRDFDMTFEVDKWTIAPEVKRRMDAIKYGLEPDTHSWLFKI
jgi:branched-chain amino acid aminotransferase